MPIQLPDLDDIDYDELVSGAIAALPGYGSDWTDYNASDPGITILEMLAWLTEMLVYRTNRIQPRTYQAFLDLLAGCGGSALPEEGQAKQAVPGQYTGDNLVQAMRQELLELRNRYRAVTVTDYEQLALTTFNGVLALADDSDSPSDNVRRVTCLPGVDVTAKLSLLGGAMSLVVLPRGPSDAHWPEPSDELKNALNNFFKPRRLATTRVRIAGPRYVPIWVKATVYIAPDARPREVLRNAYRALFDYLTPAHGGPDQDGWPFGRDVCSADLVAELAKVDGVYFVGTDDQPGGVTAAQPSDSHPDSDYGERVELAPDQLPKLPQDNITLNPMVLIGSLGQSGSHWEAWAPELKVAWQPGEEGK